MRRVTSKSSSTEAPPTGAEPVNVFLGRKRITATEWPKLDRLRVILASLYSPRFPSSGETHGISVIGGALAADPDPRVELRAIADLAAHREPDPLVAVRDVEENTAVFLSAPYGTFPQVETLLEHLARCELALQPALVVLGGATPTYLWQEVLTLPFARTVVVRGEGDLAAPAIVKALLTGTDPRVIPNIAFRSRLGEFVTTERELTPPEAVPLPERGHLFSLPPRQSAFRGSESGLFLGIVHVLSSRAH